ncbi:MAG: hypothetical protein CVV06_11020 [Gammaproteobacteria bacterium HGW-Gammaproteobacteria-10]|nr:MAG: hypothetical protein CVV06_11020 [Gammaproteobacteria bacterium HGW-Gammaproteobacteria-10]
MIFNRNAKHCNPNKTTSEILLIPFALQISAVPEEASGCSVDFCSCKICPAADTCQSSHRPPFQQLSRLFHARS